jgi:outer membrane receptor protein involved in Fe transport
MALNLYYDYSTDKIGLAEPDAIDYVKGQGRGRNPEVYYMLLGNNLLSTRNKFFINRFKLEVNSAPDETATAGYTLADMALGGNLKVMSQFISVILSANNLFDKKYIDHLSTLKEVGYFNPGRNIALSIKIPFTITKSIGK